MKRVIPLLTAVVLTLGLLGCSAAPQKPLTFAMGNESEPESLDPQKIETVPATRIYMALYEGLMAYNPKTGKSQPGLAESWTFSDEGKTITFKLRKATFSDGTPITATTVVKSWLRELDPGTAAPYAWFPAMFIAGAAEYNGGTGKAEDVKIKAIDDQTFQMTMVGPIPYAIDALAHQAFSVVPIHTIEKFKEAWVQPANFVGNGAYILKEYVPNQKVVVAKNEKYWDKDQVFIQEVTFFPISDNNTAYNKFVKGELDGATQPPLDKMDEAKLRKDFQLSPILSTYYYVFNTLKGPTKDVRVRKALSMALDRKTLVEQVTKGEQIPTVAMVPPMDGYTPAKGNPENLTEAKKLLAEAGFPEGKGMPKLKLYYNTADNHKKIAEWVQQEWKNKLGVEVELFNQEFKTFVQTRKRAGEGTWDVARAGWQGDYPDPNTFLDMFTTGADANDPKYNSPEYDELLKKAAAMPGGAERFNLLAQAEELLVGKDQALAPFYYYTSYNLIDTSKWEGWYTNVMDLHPWKGLKLKQKK